jgi:hypothetical protein
MARRRAKVQLSKVQQLENDISKWTEKRDTAILLLMSATSKLLEAKRARERLRKREAAKPVEPVETKRKPKRSAALKAIDADPANHKQAGDPGPRLLEEKLNAPFAKRMDDMGFRKVVKGKVAAALKTF